MPEMKTEFYAVRIKTHRTESRLKCAIYRIAVFAHGCVGLWFALGSYASTINAFCIQFIALWRDRRIFYYFACFWCNCFGRLGLVGCLLGRCAPPVLEAQFANHITYLLQPNFIAWETQPKIVIVSKTNDYFWIEAWRLCKKHKYRLQYCQCVSQRRNIHTQVHWQRGSKKKNKNNKINK